MGRQRRARRCGSKEHREMLTFMVSVPLIGMPGIWEWILIALAIVIFFGASKLPKLGKGLGEGIRNFKKGLKGGEGEDGLAKDGEEKSDSDK
jgi:sec-independent protein translocase protein TatA